MKTRLIPLTALILAMSMSGCREASVTPDGSATAKEAIVKFVDALLAGDRDAVMACSVVSDDHVKLVEAVVGFSAAASQFREQFIDTYGRAAWDTFQSPASSGANFQLPERITADQLAVVEDGDRATANVPGSGEATQLVKRDGEWFIHLDDQLPSGEEADDLADKMSDLADLISRFTSDIGRSGVTPEKIDTELGMEILRVLLD